MLVDDPLDLALVIVRVVHIVRAAGDGAVFVAVAVAFGSFVGRFVRAGAGGHVPIGAERRHRNLEGIARAQPGDGIESDTSSSSAAAAAGAAAVPGAPRSCATGAA